MAGKKGTTLKTTFTGDDSQFQKVVARNAQSAQQLEKAWKKTSAATSKAGKRSNAQGILELSRAADDLQYGFQGVINNIQPMVQGFGGSAKAAGALGLAIIGITVAWKLYKKLTKQGADETKKMLEAMEADFVAAADRIKRELAELRGDWERYHEESAGAGKIKEMYDDTRHALAQGALDAKGNAIELARLEGEITDEKAKQLEIQLDIEKAQLAAAQADEKQAGILERARDAVQKMYLHRKQIQEDKDFFVSESNALINDNSDDGATKRITLERQATAARDELKIQDELIAKKELELKLLEESIGSEKIVRKETLKNQVEAKKLEARSVQLKKEEADAERNKRQNAGWEAEADRQEKKREEASARAARNRFKFDAIATPAGISTRSSNAQPQQRQFERLDKLVDLQSQQMVVMESQLMELKHVTSEL